MGEQGGVWNGDSTEAGGGVGAESFCQGDSSTLFFLIAPFWMEENSVFLVWMEVGRAELPPPALGLLLVLNGNSSIPSPPAHLSHCRFQVVFTCPAASQTFGRWLRPVLGRRDGTTCGVWILALSRMVNGSPDPAVGSGARLSLQGQWGQPPLPLSLALQGADIQHPSPSIPCPSLSQTGPLLAWCWLCGWER